MGPKWYDKAEDELTDDYNNGLISLKEFNAGMRQLREEYRAEAEYVAERAREDYYGGW